MRGNRSAGRGSVGQMPDALTTKVLLDAWIPRWQFEERHSIDVRGTAGAIQAAIRGLTPGEIPLVQVLMWLRKPFVRRATAAKPILDAARGERFLMLEDTPEELVMGLAGRFWTPSGGRIRLRNPEEFAAFETPGFAKTAINFRVERMDEQRFRITTETRIVTYGRAATVKFGLYWWLAVRWGSGCIRMLWLQAIRKRVEALAE